MNEDAWRAGYDAWKEHAPEDEHFIEEFGPGPPSDPDRERDEERDFEDDEGPPY